MSVQDLERRITEIEEDYEKLHDEITRITSSVARYEAMTTGVKWVFVILSSVVAFVASIKAVFGKLISF